GRRPVFTVSNIFLIIGNIGSALSINIGMLIGFRVTMAIGSAASNALGAGIIIDVFEDHEKGKALSWYASIKILSVMCSPLLGGAMAQYLGWRSIFWLFVTSYGLLGLTILIFLPETNHYALQKQIEDAVDAEISSSSKKKSWAKMINPFSSLKLLRFPNMLLCCLYLGVIISFTWAYSTQYHFSSTMVGLFYLAGIAGNTAGTYLGGLMSDRIYMRRVGKAKEEDKQVYPEMRLSQSILFVAAFSMATLFSAYGWCIQKDVHFSAGIVCQGLGKSYCGSD
ncbi:major facilitator superfamily domain-containing protein, partial [Zychaea mexicana]|uniref:major facilitator superfamily domain-containing protein n=1 Tax=Zychaea mexicana TaxID=64656 RepID=UPI0022FE2DB3